MTLGSCSGPENTSVNKINTLIAWKLILVKRTDTNEQICNTLTSRSNEGSEGIGIGKETRNALLLYECQLEKYMQPKKVGSFFFL